MAEGPHFYKESPCAHGCGRTSIVQHADGRVLCRVCYQAEVGMDGPVAGCPTCGDRPAFEDGPNPCPCPPEIIEHLALAVRYAEASIHPDKVLGAHYVKTFMEQPSEVWCRYISEAPDG